MEETLALIKSCIISKKGGIPVASLNHEFEKIIGEAIPYERLGFSSLHSLLKEVDGLQTCINEYGEIVFTVNDPKISHLSDLISKQKRDYLKTKDKQYKRFSPYPVQSYEKQKSKRERKVWYSDNENYNKSQNIPRVAKTRFKNCKSNAPCTSNNNLVGGAETENYNTVVIESETSKFEEIVYEPIAYGHQLIGDDFFLQIAIRNLGLPVWRRQGQLALHCGLCVSGQTIKDCIKRLSGVACISNRLVIMLGAVDVYNDASGEEMIKDMQKLLKILEEQFYFSRSAITICTIPPLANLSVHAHGKKIVALYTFNNWIRCLKTDGTNARHNGNVKNYPVVDLFENFTDETYVTQYKYFQVNARMVSGCKHPYVLWNKKGRQRLMDILGAEL